MDPRLANIQLAPRPQPQPMVLEQPVVVTNTAIPVYDITQPQQPETTSTKIYNMVTSRYGAALITVIGTFLVLFFVKPPLIMQDITTNPYKKEYKINWVAVFIWSLVAGGLVLCIEPVLNYMKSQN